MDIHFECPHCGQQIVIDESGAGRQIDCPRCQSQATVPQPSSEMAPLALPRDSETQYRCNNSRCDSVWIEHQLLRETLNDKTVLLCPKCRFGVSEITKPVSFWSRMQDAFAYPFHGDGVWILASTTLLLVFLQLARKIMGFASFLAGLAVLLAAVAVMGWLWVLLVDIIRTTADDEERTMKLPDISGWGDLWEGFMQLVGSGLVVFLPAILCQLFLPTSSAWRLLTVGLWWLGTTYYPMALLAVVMSGSVSAVNPLLVIPAIVKTLQHYLLVVALLAVIWLVRVGSSMVLSVLPWGWMFAVYLPIQFCRLYGLVVSARLLGLLYRANSAKLGWFD